MSLTSQKPPIDEVEKIASQIGVDWKNVEFTPSDLAEGMRVEYEHGTENPKTNVTNDDPIATAKIALAHLYEEKNDGKTQYDYYDALNIVEDAPSGWYRGINSENYWLNKKMGKNIILMLIVISLICLFIITQTEIISARHLLMWLLGFVLTSSSYLLYTWK